MRVHSGDCHVGSVQLYKYRQPGLILLSRLLDPVLLTPRCSRLILARQHRPLDRQMSSGAQQLLLRASGLQGVSFG